MTPVHTPNPDTLRALAERCEQATGPDRELDAAIAAVQGLRAVNEGHPLGWQCYDASGKIAIFPRYTASLDAAMQLVPEGWSVAAMISEQHKHPVVKLGRSYPTNATIAQEGRTLPLTIVAAALRARAATQEPR